MQEDTWQTWHRMAAPPTDTGEAGYGHKWLQWAVAKFELLRHGPQPADYASLGEWAVAMDRQWRAASPTTQHLARVLLDFYNDGHRWKLPRAVSVADLARRCDPSNRRGLAALVIHAKGF